MKTTKVLTVVFSVLALSCLAQAASYTSDFNAGADGWNQASYLPDGERSWQASGGIGDSGYMYAYRLGDYEGNNQNLFTDDVSGIATPSGVDYAATYGQLVQIQFYMKDIDGTRQNWPMLKVYGASTLWQSGPLHIGRTDPVTGLPYPDIAAAGGWGEFNLVVDTTWSDGDAATNGWERIAGSGSWQSTLQNIVQLSIWGNGYSAGDVQEFGVDNVTVQSYGAVTPKNRGDVTEDDFVGADDLVRILTHWGESGSVPWENGDCAPYGDGSAPGDDFVGADDYVEVLTYWGTDYSTPEPAPEPATLLVLGIGALALIRRR